MQINLNPGARRMLCLVSAMVLGVIVPALWHRAGDFVDNYFGNFVPEMIMTMLFLSFIDVRICRESTGWSHVRIPIFMALLAGTAYWVVLALTKNSDFAVMAFLIGMTPTANAAPVITNLLGRRADYVTISVVVTNLFVAVSLAPITAFVIGGNIDLNTGTLAWKTLLIIGVPVALSALLRNFFPRTTAFIRRYKFLSFYLWMGMLFTVCAQSSIYISRQDALSWLTIGAIFLLSAVMCVINFAGGYFLGEKQFRRECSQSLGQKNTMLMLWVGLAFFNPIVALGPTFYVICHNLWNSWQLRQADKNQTTIQ